MGKQLLLIEGNRAMVGLLGSPQVEYSMCKASLGITPPSSNCKSEFGLAKPMEWGILEFGRSVVRTKLGIGGFALAFAVLNKRIILCLL